MELQILEVSQVNAYIKGLFDRDALLGQVCVQGELSNYKVYPSGHHYFTMKDAEGALRCVMFRSSAGRLRFKPENGMQVLAVGRITVFPRDGAYQLYCENLTPAGAGDLHVAFEQLKAKLLAEGLFDRSLKKPLPPYPHTIGIITSGAGAAIMDMLRILNKRYPLAKVKILPVCVQGAEAPAEIAGAIRYANVHKVADVLIAGRGGGSMEDLWAFNDERVARAIFASEIPVISAVGHEPDVTISDFVADVRAATPSNAAELVAPDQAELRQTLGNMQARLLAAMKKRLQLDRQQLNALAGRRVLQSPLGYLQDRRMLLDHESRMLATQMQRTIAEKKQQFAHLAAALDAMSQLKVLGRGYSVVRTEDGGVVRQAEQVRVGERLEITLRRGSVSAEVCEIREGQDGTEEIENV